MWFTYVLQGLGMAQSLGGNNQSSGTYLQPVEEAKNDTFTIVVITGIIIILILLAIKYLR
jgi:hypothetical protein